MTVAELFVNLGVKGAESAGKAIFLVHKEMKEVVSSSLAAKAAMVGVLYGLERLTAAAGREGMGFQQFAYGTGLSTDMLQKWMIAGRQFGVQGEEMTSTVRGIQNAMTDMLLGKGAPAGMGLLASKVGFDSSKARDTFYVMEQLKKFAQSMPPDIAGNVLKSFGVSETMFQFLANTKQDLNKIKPSEFFSQREIQTLAKVDVAWANIWNRMKLFGGGMVAKHGLGAIQELGHAANEAYKIANAFDKLVTKNQGLKETAMLVAAIAGVSFAPLTTALILILKMLAELDNKDSFINKQIDKSGGAGNWFKDEFLGLGSYKKQWNNLKEGNWSDFLMGTPQREGGGSGGEVKMENNVHIHTDSKDPKEHAAIFLKEVNVAFRQMNQSQVG